MPLILGAQSAVDAGYTVENSCRFNDNDEPRMVRTSGTSTNVDKFTLSFWFKLGNKDVDAATLVWFSEGAGLDPQSSVSLNPETAKLDCLTFYGRDPAGANIWELTSNRKFRDVGAWYHVVWAYDSTESVDTNRVKMFVNGTQETSFQTATYPGLNVDGEFNRGGTNTIIGAFDANGTWMNWADGYMAEAAFIDGTAYAASDFGEFDSDSPTMWKPKDFVDDLTFGDNGYYLDFKDSADLGKDVSGEGNDFTTTNLAAADQATDVPTNNFCTINPLAWKPVGTSIYSIVSEGNGIYTSSGAGTGNNSSVGCTMGFGSGKWYWEAKTTNTITCWLGVTYVNLGGNADSNGYMFGGGNGAYGISTYTGGTNGEKVVDGTQTAGVFAGIAANDIMSFAYDLDNGYFYVGVNGTYVTSGDPTSGASGTGALGALSTTAGRLYYPLIGNGNYGASSVLQMNFGGCPTFTIASGNADADGYGNFEYAPPSGYFALCTKNLGEYGG